MSPRTGGWSTEPTRGVAKTPQLLDLLVATVGIAGLGPPSGGLSGVVSLGRVTTMSVSDARPAVTVVKPRSRGGSASQTAARLLILMDALGGEVEQPCSVPEAVRVMRSLTRLEKLDFWLRNPDYLADELMTELEAGRLPDTLVREHVTRMLSESAAGHHYPMIRHHFGAYEIVDNGLSKLRSNGLIAHRRSADSGDRSRHDYYLLEAGAALAARMRQELTELRWYDQQAEAIGCLAESVQGAAARARQYEQPEYRSARIGTVIPTIFDRVRERASTMGLLEEHQ